MVDTAGLSATYGGFQKAQGVDFDNRLRQSQAINAETELAGQAAFGNTLKMFQQQVPGAQPMMQQQPMPQGPQAPAPGQPSVPMHQQPPMQNQGGGGAPMAPAPQQGGMVPGGGSIMPGQGGGGGQPQMGQLDWRVIMGKVAQANPNAPPQVLASAVNKFLPLMNQQAQMEWKQVQMYLMGERAKQGQERIDTQRDQGQQRIDVQRGAEDRRTTQGDKRIEQGDKRLDLAGSREHRLAESAKIRQDQGIQRLDIARQNLERQITQGGQRQKLSEWRATVDAQHKRAMEIIQSNALGSNLSDPDKKALLKGEDEFYRHQLEQMRNTAGSSTPSGGKPAAGGKTDDRVPSYNPATGKIEQPRTELDTGRTMSDASEYPVRSGQQYAMEERRLSAPRSAETEGLQPGGFGGGGGTQYRSSPWQPPKIKQELETVLNDYATGKITARDVQNKFKQQGWTVSLRTKGHQAEAFDPNGQAHYLDF